MLFRNVLFMVMSVIVLCASSGCRHRPRFSTDIEREYLGDSQKRYYTERFSFLSPSQSGWEVIMRKRGSISFNIRREDRIVDINISPFYLSPENFERDKQLAFRESDNFAKNIKRGKKVKVTTEIVRINEMVCVKYQSIERYPVMTFALGDFMEFTCQDPKDPRHEPGFSVRISQSIVEESQGLWDSNKLLTDIIKSIKFIPYDKATSLGYQRYLKADAATMKRIREQEEKRQSASKEVSTKREKQGSKTAPETDIKQED